MTDEVKDSFSSIGTLAAQMLGVVAILTQELVRSKSVDSDRLRKDLESFWEEELKVEDLSASDRRMVESVKRIMSGVIARGEQK